PAQAKQSTAKQAEFEAEQRRRQTLPAPPPPLLPPSDDSCSLLPLTQPRTSPSTSRSTMSRSLGIPVKLLHEAAGHVVTVELKTGEVYRGAMVECEDNWNCQLENITFTAKDGKVSQLEHVFIRGSRVRFMIIPDMLKNSPMFKRLEARIRGKGSAVGVGRGRAVAMRARAAAGRGGGPVGRGAAPPVRR
ncbi:unnamed protein product, partial [Urochloa humidicola]